MKQHIFTILGCEMFFTCDAFTGEKVRYGIYIIKRH